MTTPVSDNSFFPSSQDEAFDTPPLSMRRLQYQFKQGFRFGAYPLSPKNNVHSFETLRMPAVRLESDKPVRSVVRPFRFVLLYFMCLILSLLFTGQSLLHPLNVYLTLAWTAYLPMAIIGLIGALKSSRLKNPCFEGVITQRVIFMIPTIARMDTIPALKRVVDSILICAPRHLMQYDVHIITEEGAVGISELQRAYKNHSHVTIIIVPASYHTKNGTKYKARANQYALEYRHIHKLDRDDVFIYHGDDDTGIGHDTVWSIARFISEKSLNYDLAQGVLTYPHQLCPSWFCRLADSLRPTDDLTRFFFFTGLLGRPLAGLHGEHLLIRASIEHTIGWDFGSSVKVEDAYFGMFFSQLYPGRSTFLPSCSYGASPATISDLIKQRRRWAAGLFGLFGDSRIAMRQKWLLCYATVNWAAGLFQHIGVVLVAAFFINGFNTSPSFQIFIYFWSFSLAYFLWMYTEGLHINLDASQAPRWKYYVLPLIVSILIPVFSFIEAWSALLGLSDYIRKKKGFEVISKKL